MKLLVYMLSAMFLSYRCGRGAAQYFKEPSVFFKNITFESVLRGSYNISDCVKDHMNCWELVKPDLICDGRFDLDSVCAVMRNYCEDVDGEQEFDNRFQITESWCEWYETWT